MRGPLDPFTVINIHHEATSILCASSETKTIDKKHTLAMLCKACLEIFEEPVKLGGVRHHSSALELREEAGQTGCPLCQILVEGMPDHNNVSHEAAILSIHYLLQRGRDSTVFGYKDIAAELHLLIFSFGFGIDASEDETTKSKVFVVEPVQG